MQGERRGIVHLGSTTAAVTKSRVAKPYDAGLARIDLKRTNGLTHQWIQ